MGNDFLIMEVKEIANLPDARQLAIEMCDRHYGAGADGLIFVAPANSDSADFDSRIFNSDGSEAGVSGNGVRCAAAYVCFKNLCHENEIRLNTAAGIKRGRLVSRENARFQFAFDMGSPRLRSVDVPMALQPELERVISYPIEHHNHKFQVTCMSMGNPQCIIFVNDFDQLNLVELGQFMEHHPIFPDRTNVEFVRVLSRDEIEIRIWERGAGHTLSSGTGSCASVVAAVLNGYTNRKVRVITEGGALYVEWHENNLITLTGAAEVIYEGRWII